MLRALLLTLLAVVASGGRSAAAAPNIVLILADDLSFRDLGAWGQAKFRTPVLDRLAAGGVRFTQAYAGAPECAPSRATLLTGKHLGHATVRSNSSARGPQEPLRPDDITIAEILKKAGYSTGFVGKWGVGLPGSTGVPDKQGFDYSFGFLDQSRAHTYYPHYLYENGGRIWYPANFGFDLERLYRNNKREPDPADVNRYDDNGDLFPVGAADPANAVFSEKLVEENALRFVRDHSERPFFLYFATQLPHGPVIIDNLGELKNRDDYPSSKHKEWAAMVERIDSFTGRLIELLKDRGVFDNTLIVFASDNGYSMCGYFGRGNAAKNWPDDPFFRNKGPFRGGKFSALEGGVRVPFFVYWQGRIKPAASSVPVWLIDLLPTFADYAGVDLRHEVDGLSLRPLLEDRASEFPRDRPLYWEKFREQAVRTGPWKAYRKSPEEPIELYLIEEDIHGDRDLAARFPNVAKRIERVMAEQRFDDPWHWNPSETKADFDRKKKLAKETGQTWRAVRGNTVRNDR